MLIGECKYTNAEKGLEVLHILYEKAQKLQEKTGYRCAGFVIFSTAGFSSGLQTRAEANGELLLVQGFSPQR